MIRTFIDSSQRHVGYLFAVAATLIITGAGMPVAIAEHSKGGVGLSAEHEELTLFEFVGHIDQDGNNLVAYGYLTHVHGVKDADLFVAQPFAEANAKYTFVSQGTLDGRFVLGGVFNLVSNSSTTYYHRPAGGGGCVGIPGPSCTPNPAPFASGNVFGSGTARDSFVNVVIAPNTGSVYGTAEFTLKDVSFKAAGLSAFPLWREGTRIRINYFGQAFRTDAAAPKSFSLVAGRGSVLH